MRHLFLELPPGVMPVNVRPSVAQVLREVLPEGCAAWSLAGSRALTTALGELQSTADVIGAEAFAKTRRGRALEAMVDHQGVLKTACMTVRVRDALRDAAATISKTGINGRRLVYEAALRILDEDRPAVTTIH